MTDRAWIAARDFLAAARRNHRAAMAAIPLLAEMPWLFVDNVSEFLPHVQIRPLDNPSYADVVLRDKCREFHRRAGTDTSALNERVSRLRAGHILRLAHQPNLLAYAKLLGQFVALEELCNRVSGATPLYYFIDYDTVADDRFRRVKAPDPSRPTGFRRLQLSQATVAHRTAVARAVEPPSHQWLTAIRRDVKELADVYSRYCSEPPAAIQARADRLSSDLEFAWHNAHSLADMNAIMLSRFVTLWLELPIPFVPGHDLWMLVAPSVIADVASSGAALNRALTEAAALLRTHGVAAASPPTILPWWHVCGCGSRVGVMLTDNGSAEGTCTHCHTRVTMSLTTSELARTPTIPRILLHNIANVRHFGYVAGVTHIGSAEHILTHSIALSLLGRPVLPQLLWECMGPFGTFLEVTANDSAAWHAAQSVVHAGDASLAYFALCEDPSRFRATLSAKAQLKT